MMADTLRDRIGLPLRTPFVALFRVHNGWFAWIAVRDTQAPYSQWQGTYLHLHDDGSADRITVYDDGHEDVICIKERDQ